MASVVSTRSRLTPGFVAALLVAVCFMAPLLVGFAGTVWQAAGGEGAFEHVRTLLADPRLSSALALTLFTGGLASLLVAMLTIIVLVSTHGTWAWRALMTCVPPLLAVPHAALAVGIAFLLAPSGWIMRWVSPWLTGFERPPVDWTVPDAHGLSLVIGLVVKETPFLLLAAAAQLRSLDVDASLRIGRTLGYSPARCWSRLILPRLWPRVRLTFLVIVAFNFAVVDMAILLGPGHPPTLAVWLVQLVADPATRTLASVGALMLAILVALACLAVLLAEEISGRAAVWRRRSGHRGHGFALARQGGQIIAGVITLTGVLSLVVLPIWSVASRWRFPQAWPSKWTLDHWSRRLDTVIEPTLTTLSFAVVTAVLAIVAGIVWLEAERRGRVPRLDGVWYLPLLIPQTALLFGWQVAALRADVDGSWGVVLHAHWVYALPYVVLILATAWRELDPRWEHAAATLGAGYWRILWRVRLPLLAGPVAQASAVAASVSVAQYLPTLLLGAGRQATLATELIAGQGGMDRRSMATLAVLQALLPLLAFVLALRWQGARRSRQTNVIAVP